MAGDQTRRVRKLNDSFRIRVLDNGLGQSEMVSGTFVMTAGIAGLEAQDHTLIWRKVGRFASFNEDNDPYGEHDFGKVTLPGVGDIFWKIDVYADASCTWGSEHPNDPGRSYRVLTVMLAEEY